MKQKILLWSRSNKLKEKKNPPEEITVLTSPGRVNQDNDLKYLAASDWLHPPA